MRRVWLWLAVALAACQGSVSVDRLSPGPASPRTPALLLADSLAGLDTGVSSLVLNFENTRDLCVRAWLPEVSPLARTRLIVRDPHGAEFFESNRVFSTDRARTSIDSGGMGRPLYVHPAVARDGGWALDQCFAIGGSIFQRIAHHDDAWGIELMIEGRPGALAATMFHRSKP